MRVGEIALIAVCVLGTAIGTASLAAADPPPPPEVPIDAPPAPEPMSYRDALRAGPLAQSNDTSPGIAGLPDLSALGDQLLLGQTSVPALPGAGPAGIPIPNALNNSYLLPQNVKPAAPGDGQIFGVEPGQENADIKRRDYLHRLYEMYQAGGLEGALLGQRPRDQLDQPLPEPPPG
jgi:hypothetical protein